MVEHFADCVLHDRPVRYPVSEAAARESAAGSSSKMSTAASAG